MTSRDLSRLRIFLGIVLGIGFLFSLNVLAASTIQGTVYDKQRNPLRDLEVELLNDLYQSVGRSRTDGSGRYQFNGLSNGRYSVKVYAFRYDLEDQTISLEINTQNVRGGEGSGYFQQDFYLLPRKGGLGDTELAVVFAQDVPPAAKGAYEQALRDLSGKRITEGIMGLNEAVRVFPTYFLALHRMGKELFILRKYKEAIPFLMSAVDVNRKSASSLYYLGYCLHHMGAEYDKAALTALNQAVIMAPASMQVLYVLGKVERRSGKYQDAEKHLLQAKRIARVAVPEIHIELAQLYGNDLKRFKEAADELELYLKASKISGSETVVIRKKISDMREKAKIQTPKS
jgi:tetratricopeptide (TPR) repeat protein